MIALLLFGCSAAAHAGSRPLEQKNDQAKMPLATALGVATNPWRLVTMQDGTPSTRGVEGWKTAFGLPARLMLAREGAHLSVEAMADTVNTIPAMIIALEDGTIPARRSVEEAYARVTGCDVEWLRSADTLGDI
jgi:hypothetical protein